MGFVPLHQLHQSVLKGALLNCEVEVSGQVIGFVSSLITDKYDRLIGIEVNLYHGHSSLIVPIPHSWIKGYEQESERIQLNIPPNLQRNFITPNDK